MRVPAHFVPELGGAFGFSESELAANAEGRMTGKQRLRLLANGFWYWLFLAFIAVMTAAVAIRTAMVLANGFGPVVVLLVGILLLFALALGLVWRWALRSAAEARTEAPARYEGSVSVLELEADNPRGVGSYLSHYLDCGVIRFAISYKAYRIMEDRQRWRIFYSPRSRRVLSIEPLFSFDPARAREQHPPTSYASAIAVFLFGLVLMVIGLAIGLAVGLTDTLVATFIVVGALFALVGAPLYALGIRWGISN